MRFMTLWLSEVSYMEKPDEKPSFSASRRRMRRHAEWNVHAQTSFASGPSIRSSRALSSPAALFVNVIARMRHGSTGSSAAYTAASSPPTRSSESVRSSAKAGSSSQSLARPKLSRFAMRFINTVVLPLPAPASISSGPSVAITASICLSLS